MKVNGLLKTAAILAMAGAVSTALAVPVPVANITINGDLSDWGVVLANNNASNIMPNTVAPGSSSPHCSGTLNSVWACEDTNDKATTFDANGGFVGPEWGGQDYDVEFLGAARGSGADASKLFIGIASGLRPDNGSSLYAPGDLFLKINGVAYVIEMGGGAGHTGGAALGAETQGAAGSFYNLDGNGYTVSQTSLANQTVGSIWRVSDGTTTQTSWATQATQWQKSANAVSVGNATVYSTLDSLTGNQNQHAVIEMGIDLALFGVSNQFTTIDELRWGPSCYNDVLAIEGSVAIEGTVLAVPEPATLPMLGLGLLAFAGLRRRAQQSRPANAARS